MLKVNSARRHTAGVQQYLRVIVCVCLTLCLSVHSASYKDTLLNDIRKARDKYQGEELAKELTRIKLRIDNTEMLTQDIVMNLLFSYRDIQDYDAMVKLVETLEMLPTCDLANQHMIQFHYAFALNRRNSPGDREKALRVMLQVLQSCDHPAPDMFCLCGRIYKDIFLDSDCKDTKNRENAIQWYRKGFDLQPTLYSGINLAVLLIVSGQQFESSMELRKIGVRLNSLLGRKGSLEKMNNYWDVGQFFTVGMLASDIPKAVQAAEKLFKLKPPVLILEPTKIYQPSYVSINSEADEKNVSIWHVSPAETKGIHEWNFTATSIKGISISKFDERCCFLYVHDNSDDFQIYFSTECQCGRYSQPLHEEIALHKYLKHRNIVQYLGSVSEDGYIKIFMEQVPGGSLSALLRSKWGPLKESTIIFYTRQILEGLRYLHENQIVHRDIKGDNVLVNTYSGVLKISDFGTSKRLAGVNPCTETFTAELRGRNRTTNNKAQEANNAKSTLLSNQTNGRLRQALKHLLGSSVLRLDELWVYGGSPVMGVGKDGCFSNECPQTRIEPVLQSTLEAQGAAATLSLAQQPRCLCSDSLLLETRPHVTKNRVTGIYTAGAEMLINLQEPSGFHKRIGNALFPVSEK
ncbi:UNVERIFIED_CONTAM: hypothetical protein FKN15_037205 [Acipenser sinensis]